MEHIRAIFLGQAAGGSLHHTVEHAVGFLAGQNGHRLVVHAQQQGNHLPHSAAVEGREDRCRCRGSQCITGACHCHTGGGAGAGRNRRDAARRLARVDPDRSGAGAIVVDIVGVQSGICGHGIIAVDRRRGKGQLGGVIGHKGALHTAEQHRGQVDPAIRHGKAQRGGIGLVFSGAGRQGIIEEHSGIFQGQALPLHGAQTGPQAQAAGLVELCRREAAAQGSNIIAQQLEGGGTGLFQRHTVVGPERAVGVAAEPPLLDGNADIGGIFVPAVHVGEQGTGIPLRGGALPVGRECHQQLCQLAPGQGGAQGGGLFAGHAAQRHGSLHRRIAGSGICRHHQHRAGNAHRQQKGKDSFFHGRFSLRSCFLYSRLPCQRSSARRWRSQTEAVRGLIISQCFNGVQPCGALGRQVAEQYTDAHRDAKGHQH